MDDLSDDERELAAEPELPGARGTLNGLAVVSLALGFLWVLWVGSLMAIAFGHVAKRQIDSSNGMQRGHDIAVAGLTLGYAAFALLVLGVVLGLVGLLIGAGDTTTYPTFSS